FWPRRAFRTSDPQRTESKPSASQMRLAQKSGMTSTRIPIIRLIFIKHFIATFLVLLLLASTKGREGPPVSVPADCQQFLNKYFDAWKSKDIATLQALSFYLSPEDRSRLPEGSLELWRQSKNKLVAENFEQVTRDFGDFKSYEVLR